MCAANDLTTKTDAATMRFNKLQNKVLIEYAERLWTKALRMDRVYDKFVHKGNSLEVIKYSIRQRRWWLQGSNKHATVQEFSMHENSLNSFQIDSRSRKEHAKVRGLRFHGTEGEVKQHQD